MRKADIHLFNEIEVKIGGRSLPDCSETDVLIDDLKHARRILRMNIRRRKFIAQHLATSTSPLNSNEIPDEMNPETYTVENTIMPLLSCLGYTKGSIVRHGGHGRGAGGPDILLKLKDACIVMEAKPIDTSSFEDKSLQILSYIADNREKNCICGIFTDGVRWKLAVLADRKPVFTPMVDLREVLKFLYSAKPNEADYAMYTGRWKEFIETFSADSIQGAARALGLGYRKHVIEDEMGLRTVPSA